MTSTSDKSNNATISATADPVAVDFDNLDLEVVACSVENDEIDDKIIGITHQYFVIFV